jgi:hypothetical protein
MTLIALTPTTLATLAAGAVGYLMMGILIEDKYHGHQNNAQTITTVFGWPVELLQIPRSNTADGGEAQPTDYTKQNTATTNTNAQAVNQPASPTRAPTTPQPQSHNATTGSTDTDTTPTQGPNRQPSNTNTNTNTNTNSTSGTPRKTVKTPGVVPGGEGDPNVYVQYNEHANVLKLTGNTYPVKDSIIKREGKHGDQYEFTHSDAENTWIIRHNRRRDTAEDVIQDVTDELEAGDVREVTDESRFKEIALNA